MALPRGAMRLPAVYDCGISLFYRLESTTTSTFRLWFKKGLLTFQEHHYKDIISVVYNRAIKEPFNKSKRPLERYFYYGV